MAEVYSRRNGLAVNYYVIIAIFVGVILFQSYLEISENLLINEDEGATGMLSEYPFALSIVTGAVDLGLELAIGMFALYLAYRYDFSRIMGKPYLFFAGGFFSIVVGKILLHAGVVTFPGIDTLFFFGMYAGVSLFLLIQIRHYNAGFGIKNILIATPVVAVLVSLFYVVTFAETGQSNFDLHYCGASVFGTALVAALSVVGVKTLRKNPIGNAWIILMIGLITLTLSDVWFHYLDTTYLFSDTHMVNAFVYASYMIIIYGLYKHVRVF